MGTVDLVYIATVISLLCEARGLFSPGTVAKWQLCRCPTGSIPSLAGDAGPLLGQRSLTSQAAIDRTTTSQEAF
jgi:hypothetical protein